jgi:NAD-dependent SIR2 family protein deacetylase
MGLTSTRKTFQPPTLDANMMKIIRCRRVILITGAGVSAPSGLRPFSGAAAIQITADTPSHTSDWQERPHEVIAYHRELGEAAEAAEPNAGHLAITICQERMVAANGALTIFTLNTDELHERANSHVHHVYGQLSWELCEECGTHTPALHRPSTCACGGKRRPDRLLRGEGHKYDAEVAFRNAVKKAEAIICVGTSGESDAVRTWLRVATDHYNLPSLLLTRHPTQCFADMFDSVVDNASQEIRHYLPR